MEKKVFCECGGKTNCLGPGNYIRSPRSGDYKREMAYKCTVCNNLVIIKPIFR